MVAGAPCFAPESYGIHGAPGHHWHALCDGGSSPVYRRRPLHVSESPQSAGVRCDTPHERSQAPSRPDSGIALSAIAPFLISREPGLALDILEPQQQEDFVAPLSVTYSLERAAEILRRRGLRPILYIWDYEGDGRPNEETVLPFATAIYERQGSYTPSVRINLDDGMSRRVGRRLLIPRAVFSVSPLKPIIEKPVRFSIRHLVAKPEEVKEAMWDFDGDNEPDQVTTATDVVHTYYAVERIPVSVVVTLTNQTQVTFERMIDISKPEPPPFPVALITEPKLLMGPGRFRSGLPHRYRGASERGVVVFR